MERLYTFPIQNYYNNMIEITSKGKIEARALKGVMLLFERNVRLTRSGIENIFRNADLYMNMMDRF